MITKIFLAIILSISLPSIALSEEKNLDIYMDGSYKMLKAKSNDIDFSGAGIGAGTLYTFPTSTNIKPVIGAYFDYNATGSNSTFIVFDHFNYASAVLNLGAKYKINSFSLFLLSNFGYAYYNDYGLDNAFMNTNLITYEIKDHYFVGGSLLGSYAFGDVFSMGLKTTANYHVLNKKLKIDGPIQFNDNSNGKQTYLETGIGLVLLWSI
ncbi:hypothetical protein QEJ31_00090 [Pigmentibacter sp. JX0631]|uniref:hypothetical protein n=1 Tax=Pigmentibacter sp. JX0631 TaxID=2976982 RepID=UPI002468259E|nr:hypothetical protein [Pigmentibacter sp. JX0631]WGL60001.1 hypothetical protein QEJ31_00090 [Pigmentibacter sp. JX0631]